MTQFQRPWRICFPAATYVTLIILLLCSSLLWVISEHWSGRLQVVRGLDGVGCRYDLSIAAHGDADTDAKGVLQLETYLNKHPNVAGLILLKRAGVLRPSLRLYNVGNRAAGLRRIFERNSAFTRSCGAVMNALLAIAVNDLKSCAVWEVDVNSTMIGDVRPLNLSSHLLKPPT